MKKIIIALVFALMCSWAAMAQSKEELEVRAMLTAQVANWNNGSIDGYMNGYWESDKLLFIGSNGPTYGYRTTLKRYKEHYPDAAHMGVLTSNILSIEKLSKKYYFVVGNWAIKRSAGDVKGSYSLLIKKIKDKWVIVCDHTN
jgi:ketosteroid isomerase-like protein